MQGKRQVRQAIMWGCIAWLSACPEMRPGANTLPLVFGMTAQAASEALAAPLARWSGHRGSEVYYAELPGVIPGFYPYDRRIWLQFRRGHLTGWKNDWERVPSWLH